LKEFSEVNYPKKKFVSKKGSYSRLRRSSKVKDSFHDRKHFSLDHNIKYPFLLRIALSKGRYTPLLFKKISKYNQKLLLMRKEALSYQMRFIYDNRRLLRQLKLKKINRLNEKIRKRNAFVKGIDARMGTKTKKIKERKLVYKIKKRDPKTKKWSLKKIRIKETTEKSRIAILWKTLYRVNTRHINKISRKLLKKTLKIDSDDRNNTLKFRRKMAVIVNASLALVTKKTT